MRANDLSGSVQMGFSTMESRGALRSGSLTRFKEARQYLQDRRSERTSPTSPDTYGDGSMEVKGIASRLPLVDEQQAASETPYSSGSGRGVLETELVLPASVPAFNGSNHPMPSARSHATPLCRIFSPDLTSSVPLLSKFVNVALLSKCLRIGL